MVGKADSRKTEKATIPITGMTCTTCAATIEKSLTKTPGVEQANVNFASEKAAIEYDPSKVDLAKIKNTISQLGYGAATKKSIFPVGGMTCASCVARVEQALSGVPGVISANVNLASEKATVELLIRERSKGKSLRQLGQMFDRSHERIRQILAKYGPPLVTVLPEERVAAKLGCPVTWLVRLRKEGIVKPMKPGSFWLYSEEQVRQIPSLIAEKRKCEQCGKLRLPGSRRFCIECSQYRRKRGYKSIGDSARGN